jgi:hypothetical protein
MAFTVACGERAVSAPKEAFIRILAGEFGAFVEPLILTIRAYPEKLPMSSFGLLSQREEEKKGGRGEMRDEGSTR